jgi:hypothetical protein
MHRLHLGGRKQRCNPRSGQWKTRTNLCRTNAQGPDRSKNHHPKVMDRSIERSLSSPFPRHPPPSVSLTDRQKDRLAQQRAKRARPTETQRTARQHTHTHTKNTKRNKQRTGMISTAPLSGFFDRTVPVTLGVGIIPSPRRKTKQPDACVFES